MKMVNRVGSFWLLSLFLGLALLFQSFSGRAQGQGLPDYGTNLWLEVTNASNGQINGWIHNSTPIMPHAISSRQRLPDAGWMPTAVFYGTAFATNTPFFDIPMFDRSSMFFLGQLPLAPRQIAAGFYFNVAIDRDQTVWAWGYDDDGELGNGTFTGSYIPVQVIGLSNIVAVASEEGSFFTLALDSGGNVWSWGGSYYGELGQNNGIYESQNIPVPVWGLSNIVSIATEQGSGLALRSDGTVWAWGYDEFGDLGDGSINNRDYAAPVIGITNAIAITGGDDHAFALCADGSVWAWGRNGQGQLGAGFFSVYQNVPVPVMGLTNAVELGGTFQSSIALLSNGTVMAWGGNYYGELGNGTNGNFTASNVPIPVAGLSNIVAVAGGDDNFLAFDTNGNLYVWGYGEDGELGNGLEDNTNVPISVTGVSNLVAIAGAEASMLAMSADGKIYQWGQLVDNSSDYPGTNYPVPFEIDMPALPLDDASGITAYFPAQYVNTNVVTAFVLGGAAAGMAILVNNTNFSSAQWTPFNPTPTINLGPTDGVYQVWFGFQGQNGIGYWSMKPITLDTTPPVISFTAPMNDSSFNLSSVNVQGNFVEANFSQLQVDGVQAFISGTNFTVLNVPLSPGTNFITAVAEDLAGNYGTNFIVVIGVTNDDGSMDVPVQLAATPIAGFAPLTVTLEVTSNAAPGTFQQISYDFNGDGIADFVTNSLDPITYTYATNGEYFPVATIQTTAGTFSSSGGWNSTDQNRLQITVQLPVTQIGSFNVTDPVDIKWVAPGDLYVLSGSTATLMEMDTNGNVIRSISGLGSNPSGFDVDTNGDVYIAVTSSNQILKLDPAASSFVADPGFGSSGIIGPTNGMADTNNGSFNAPFSVAVSPDNSEISVSDSGNNRIEQFDSSGNFLDSFGAGQLNTPEGLTYDSYGTLYIVDSGNSRIVLAEGYFIEGATGTNGTAPGQISGPLNISAGERGIYIADTGNNRIQSFNLPAAHLPFSVDPTSLRFAVSTGLSQPAAVTATGDLLNETFYVADTGNNRVVLYEINGDNPLIVWNSMTNCISAGNITGALAYFSVLSEDDYRDLFSEVGTNGTISTIGEIGTLTPSFITDSEAEYNYDDSFNGQPITGTLKFLKENGVWKILEF